MDRKEIPEEIKKWNWGAFMFNWIWGLFNHTYIALLSLVPIIGLIVAIVLGFHGNEYAWTNKEWDSIEHFNKIQKRWNIAGIILFTISFIGFLLK